MDAERWEKVGEIFSLASEMQAAERESYLLEACGNDTELLAEVRSLLAAGSQAGSFISQPIVGKFVPDFVEHAQALSPGSRIGHYTIEKAIGSGGMGEVYLATDTKLDRQVALKTLPPSFASDPGFLRRFRNEAQAAANLNHAHVATVYSVEEIRGMRFITMEYVDGKTLDHLTPDGGLEIRTFLNWFEPVADALAHAHKRGIIHRDIKPGNIMISTDGTPKVLDFGLAQFEGSQVLDGASRSHITAPGQVIGTPSYMSPEQAEGAAVDARSDIFSFGTVMYEALTGVRPFRGTSQGMIVRAVIHHEPEPIASVCPEVPAVIEKMVSKCLEKSPEKRFQSMAEVRAILKDVRTASDAGVSMDSFARRFYREAGSTSKLWWAAAAILVMVLSVGGWYFFSGPDVPSFAFERIALRKLSQSNNVIYAHITPDGNSVAYTTVEANEMRSLWLRRISDRNALQLLPPAPVQFWGGLEVSKDGSTVYYVTAERAARHGTLYRISSVGGTPRKIADTVNDLGSLSPDGERLLFVRYGERTDLISCKASDGTDERVVHSGTNGTLFRDPHYSLDGKKIYSIRFDRVAGVESWSLIEVPAEGGEERVVMPRQSPKISEIAVLNDGRNLILNATDPTTNLAQIYNLSLGSGGLSRITNDLNFYFGVSVDSRSEKIVTAQRFDSSRVWIGELASYKEMRPITPEPNAWLETAWTPDGRIVYDAVDNNRPHIFIINDDGTNLQQLTPSESSDHTPRVTPDGKYIVFTSDRTGSSRIWRMNLDGSEPVQLSPTDGVSEGPEISGDGRYVYFSFTGTSARGIGRVPIEGGPMELQLPYTEQYWVPSPDGKFAAVTHPSPSGQNPKLAVVPIGTSEPVKVIDVWPIYVVKWSADGKRIIYREREAGKNPYSSIWEYDLDTGLTRLLLDVTPDIIRDAAFSADGKKFAVLRGKLITDAVLLTNVAGTATPPN